MENFARSKFAAAVIAYWDAIDHASSRQANAKNRLLEKIVEEWHRQQIAIEALRPFLEDTNAKLRQAAAAFLLRYPETREEAISILKDLQANDPTLVSTTAGAILRIYVAGKLLWQIGE